MYHFIGKRLREAIPDITLENEAEMLRKLKVDIDTEVEGMTPQRGRQHLAEERIILFLG